MNLIRRLRVWWDDLSWMGEAEEFIDEFLDGYKASGGPKPMDKRREGETMREYRARFVEWLTAPRVYPNWASDTICAADPWQRLPLTAPDTPVQTAPDK